MMREEERGELNCNGIYFMAVGVVPIEGARKTNTTQGRDAERINLVVQDNLVNVRRRRWVCRRFVRKTYCQMFFRHIVRS